MRRFGFGDATRQLSATRALVESGIVSAMRPVPSFILKPEYYKTGRPQTQGRKDDIRIYNSDEIVKIKDSAKLARQILEFALSLAKVGVSTDEIDRHCHEEIVRHNAYPSPINYYGFPKAICTSVNEVVCHGIPDSRPLEAGDILSIDVSVYMNGFHGDNCGTIVVGGANAGDEAAFYLVKSTEDALNAGIAVCGPGACLSEIGEAIEKVAESNGHMVIRDFLGHGLGTYLHMQPLVYHYRNDHKLPLRPGMVFTIEPILTEGPSAELEMWDDSWTAVTADGSRAAQFEHEVLITEHGAEVITVYP